MELIGMLDSPYVRRVAIALKLLGLPFDHRSLSVFRHVEDFSLVNPLVKAPTLVCDDGTVLVDSTLILDYIEELAGPDKSLMPQDPGLRLKARQLIGIALVACEKTVQIVYERTLRPEDKQHQVRDLLEGIETRENRARRQETRKDLERSFPPPPVPQPDAQPLPQERTRTPWGSELFYLFVLAAGTALFAIVSHFVPWYILPVVIIGAFLTVGIIGAFQLKQENQLSEEHFVTLIMEAYKRLPLLKGPDKLPSSTKNDDSP